MGEDPPEEPRAAPIRDDVHDIDDEEYEEEDNEDVGQEEDEDTPAPAAAVGTVRSAWAWWC